MKRISSLLQKYLQYANAAGNAGVAPPATWANLCYGDRQWLMLCQTETAKTCGLWVPILLVICSVKKAPCFVAGSTGENVQAGYLQDDFIRQKSRQDTAGKIEDRTQTGNVQTGHKEDIIERSQAGHF
jgi:hypothetical protein